MTSVLDTGLLQTSIGEAALRAVILAVVVGLGLALLRVRDAHTRLAVWRAVLVGALAMPLLMSWMVVTVSSPVHLPLVAATAMDTAANTALNTPHDAIPDGAFYPRAANAPAAFDWHTLILPVYAGVAGLMVLRLIVGLVLTLRLRRAAAPLRAEWTAGEDVRVSCALYAPVTVGTTILIPADHASWSDETRRAVLLHERAHAGRGDFYVQLLAGLHRALFWFSPLAWWLNDKLAELAELASDAEAAGDMPQRASYAEVLLNFAAKPRAAIGLVAVGMARPATVRRRIDYILANGVLSARLKRGAQAMIAIMLLPFVLAAATSFAQGPITKAPIVQTPLAPPTPLVPQQTPASIDTPAVQPAPAGPEPVVRKTELRERLDNEIQQRIERDAAREQERAERRADRAKALAETQARRDSDRLQRMADLGVDPDTIRAQVDEVTRNLPQINAQAAAAVKEALKWSGASSDTESIAAALRQSGAMVKEQRNVTDFNSVSLATGFGSVIVTAGAGPSLVLEGDAETLRDIKSEVRHGTLVIELSDAARDRGRGSRRPISAYVTVPALHAVSLSGSGRVQLAGLNGGETAIKLSGSGVIEATGRLDKLSLKISGSGRADLPSLEVGDANIDISGSGDAIVRPTGNLMVDISGSARVHYVGSPARISTSISGRGTVHPL